jgi:hypothetical protein
MNVLLRRRADGIGDWLFMLACIKHYNRQRPDVRFYVDFELPARAKVGVKLPPIILEAYQQSDVTWYPFVSQTGYTVVIPHVVYKQRDSTTYIESMLAQLAVATGVAVAYDPACLPKFIYPDLEDRPANYVALAPHAKAATSFKDWRRSMKEARIDSPWDELGHALERSGFEIAHVGQLDGARHASATRRYLGCSFDTVCGVLAGARLFVGCENGISVLSSWLGTPTIVLYADGGDQGNKNRRARWCGPAIAQLMNPPVADVLMQARKELKC